MNVLSETLGLVERMLEQFVVCLSLCDDGWDPSLFGELARVVFGSVQVWIALVVCNLVGEGRLLGGFST